jgi:hypothetical protein
MWDLDRIGVVPRFFSDVGFRRISPLMMMLRCVIAVMVVFTSPSTWYRRQYVFLRTCLLIFGKFRRLRKPDKVLAVYLNSMLALTTRSGIEFDIPVCVKGEDLLKPGFGHLICGTHLPLNKVGLTGLMRMGKRIDGAIAADPDPDMRMAIWGTTYRIPALKADATVLLRARGMFRQGLTLAVMIDRRRMSFLSANSLKLAALCGVEASLILSRLQPDGIISVELLGLPFPGGVDEVSLQANLAFIRDQHEKVDGGYMLKTT